MMDAVSSNNANGVANAGAVNGGSGAVPPFLSKTYDMVNDPVTDSTVSWSSGGNSFVVWNVPQFSRDLLPKYFKHNNFSSFVRQLNTYGFRKVDPDRWEFANEGFLRGHKHLLKNINRRKSSHAQNHQQQPQAQKASSGACVDLGKFGLEEEVEQLKRDKNVLMQELVRLRQHQQTTDQHLHTVGQRVKVMEQRQQQMMSFLAKAMQSPGFLAQLVPQKNDGNRRIVGGNKKRRLSSEGEEDLPGDYSAPGLDGQIVKYQPSMNEAAISMLRQILKMNSSPRFEQARSKSSAFLIDDTPPSSTLDSESISSHNPGLTGNVSQSELVGSCYPAAVSETQSSPFLANEYGKSTQNPDSNVGMSRESITLPEMPQTQGNISSDDSSRNPNVDLMGPDTGDADLIMDGTLPMEANGFSPPLEMSSLTEGIPKLPSISDSFWEQFLATALLTEDTDEINLSSLDGSVLGDQFIEFQQENGWDKNQNMDHLTDQMGLLTSDNGKA